MDKMLDNVVEIDADEEADYIAKVTGFPIEQVILFQEVQMDFLAEKGLVEIEQVRSRS